MPFFRISASEFVEMFVGVGASRIRDLFEQAKRNSPCFVFVDEIDAVGRQRGAGLGGSHDEREQTLNQILVELDGFDRTRRHRRRRHEPARHPRPRPPAPRRFDRQVVLDRPDIRVDREILKVHARASRSTRRGLRGDRAASPGFSGADLANLVNEAAILAARRNKKSSATDEINEAIDRSSPVPSAAPGLSPKRRR